MAIAQHLPPGDKLIQRIRSFIVEARSLDQGVFGLKTVPLVVDLSASANSGNQTWTVPDRYTFRMTSVRPHLPIVDPLAVPLADAATYNPSGGNIAGSGDAEDYFLLQAQNILVSLRTTYNRLQFFRSGALPLSALMQPGGMPHFGMPNIIRGGTVVEAKFSASDATLLPASARPYGIHLIGALIPEE